METAEKVIQAFSVPVLIFALVIGSSLFCWFAFNGEPGTSVPAISIAPAWIGIGLVLAVVVAACALLVKVMGRILS